MRVAASIKGRVKRRLEHLRQRRRLAPVIDELKRTAPEPLGRPLALRLARAWGNEEFAASPDYLVAVAEEARLATGPVVECGSGLSTLVLGVYARGGLWTLEHHRRWRDIVADHARHFGIEATIVHCELRNYGEFDWYTKPSNLPSGVSVVICDGPPGKTRGGRSGALPVLREHLAPGAVLLLDDAERPGEREALATWKATGDVSVSEPQETSRAYAVVHYRGE